MEKRCSDLNIKQIKIMNLEKNIKPLLGLLIIILGFSYFFAILIIEKKARPDVIIAIVAMVTGVTGYYLGSSAGSAKKDETISKQMTFDNTKQDFIIEQDTSIKSKIK